MPKIHVDAPSRLHFGFFALPGGPEYWGDRTGRPLHPRRDFGGVGLMIESPGVSVTLSPSDTLAASGPLGPRALEMAKTLASSIPLSNSFHVHAEGLEHVGLGTGTQLALAVSTAFATWTDTPFDASSFALSLGRGKRSAIGVHGHGSGGMIVEAGKRFGESLAPLVSRVAFPENWPIVLLIPQGTLGEYGVSEANAFGSLASRSIQCERADQQVEALCRLTLLGMMPAVLNRDYAGFGEAVHDFNARVGEMFAPWQGGVYANERSARLVAGVRAAGISAVGQSSWGPTIFAIAPDADRADHLLATLDRQDLLAGSTVIGTKACNRGAKVSQTSA